MEGDRNKNKVAAKLGIMFLPVPGMGHLVAMVELAKHILQHCANTDSNLELVITVLRMNLPSAEPDTQARSYIASASASSAAINFLDLPAVEPPPATRTEAFVTPAVVELHKPLVRDAVLAAEASDPSIHVAALVLDLFCGAMIDVADELGVASYFFFSTSAAAIGLLLHLPAIASELTAGADGYEGGKTLDLPGFTTPFPLTSMPDALLDPREEAFMTFCSMGRQFLDAKGFLVNTFTELQSSPMKALLEGLYHRETPTVYAVGPILSLKPGSADAEASAGVDERHECMRWLDGQPPVSVVFLCFGSNGWFTAEQAAEIAAGLERSGQRFLWVLRGPPAKQSWVPSDAVLEEVLPEGFLERTKNRGMVWPSYAPQTEILAHGAVGGFVTHCGWNSCLESIWYGLPMAAWPLYADHHFNAFEMAREMGVAVEVQIDRKQGNWASAGEVERVVNLLMSRDDSSKVREKVKQLECTGRTALKKGGSSFQALERFVQELIASRERGVARRSCDPQMM